MRVWEFADNKAIPSDLVLEQDFILRVRRLQRLGTPHFVINLALRAVEPLAKSQRALEAVQQQLAEFAKITNGTYSQMSNGDAFIVWEETADAHLLTQRLLKVIKPDAHDNEDTSKYLLIYHLPGDYTALRERANHYVEVVHAAASLGDEAGPADALRSEAARGPLTAWSVDQIERLLSDIDLRHYSRTQNVYRHDGGQWKAVREEYFISFEDLRRERFPKLEIITPEHLFLALCEHLDQRLLMALTENRDAIRGHEINLNLSVGTVIGSPFAQFTRSVPKEERHKICFELHRGDLLQDFARTLSAIDVLKQEGFQVALDSITPDMVPYINLPAFNADFIKINVSRDRTEQLADPAIRAGLKKIPSEKLIFFRCDSEKVLTAGLEMGISLFQGWLIDDVTHPKK